MFILGVYISFYQYTIYRIAELFSLDGAMMGVTIGVQSIGMALPPLLLGLLSEKIGKKRVVLIAYCLMIAGTALAGFAGSLIQFLTASFIIGAGFAVVEATLSAVLADEFSNNAVRHLNFSQVAFSLGALGGPILTATLIQRGVNFQNLYHYYSIIFILLGGLFFTTRQQNNSVSSSNERISIHITKFFRNRILLILAIAIFFYVGIENTTANFIDAYFREIVSLPNFSATALSLFWGAMIPSRLLAGIFKKNTKAIFIGGCAVVFLSVLIAMVVPSPVVKLIMFAMCGFGCGPLWPLLMNEAAKASRGSSGAIMNIMFSFCAMGGAVMPMIAGIIANNGNISGAYYLCAGATILTLFLWFRGSQTDILRAL